MHIVRANMRGEINVEIVDIRVHLGYNFEYKLIRKIVYVQEVWLRCEH